MKMFGFGIRSPPDGNFLSGWNRMDATVVAISLADQTLSMTGFR